MSAPYSGQSRLKELENNIKLIIFIKMTAKPTSSIIHHFSSIEDPRVNRQKKHQLQDIFFISICAIICGADNWVAVEEFGVAKEEWFTEVLGLKNGIPSHDTFGDVYAGDYQSSCRLNGKTYATFLV